MRFLRNIFVGIRAYFKAIRLIIRHKMYWYIAIPAILMLLIYYVGDRVRSHEVSPDVKTMNGIIWYLIYLLTELSVALLLMKFSKYLVVSLLSPLLSQLSQKTENLLTGNSYTYNFKQLVADVKRALRIIVRNLMWEYFFFLIILLISMIGWKEATSSPVFYLTYLIGFYYYGFSFMDYVNERRRLSMDESIVFVRKNRGLAMMIGAGYSLLIIVPVELDALFNFSRFSTDFPGALGNFSLNLVLWLCASTAPILAIVTSTVAMNDIVDLSSNPYAKKSTPEALD